MEEVEVELIGVERVEVAGEGETPAQRLQERGAGGNAGPGRHVEQRAAMCRCDLDERLEQASGESFTARLGANVGPERGKVLVGLLLPEHEEAEPEHPPVAFVPCGPRPDLAGIGSVAHPRGEVGERLRLVVRDGLDVDTGDQIVVGRQLDVGRPSRIERFDRHHPVVSALGPLSDSITTVTPMAAIVTLEVADPAPAWVDLGFSVTDGVCAIDGIAYVLDAAGKGIVSWTVDGLADKDVNGLSDGPVIVAGTDPGHANGVVALDHLVISTPDLGRAIEGFEAAGLDLRRTRDAGRIHQAFFKAGEVVLEVIGPPQPSGDGPARFFGLAWTVADLDATAAYLGDRLHPAKDAVQKGRRIATLDKTAGSTVAHAFMSP